LLRINNKPVEEPVAWVAKVGHNSIVTFPKDTAEALGVQQGTFITAEVVKVIKSEHKAIKSKHKLGDGCCI